MLRPRSRGSVLIASDDPSAKPAILHNYFSEDVDMQAMVAGLRIGLEISRQPALAAYAQTPFMVPASDSDEDLRAHARRYTQTLYHPTSTCAIGQRRGHRAAGAGSRGPARGRRVGACRRSCAATPTRPTIAVAERAADLIRGVTVDERRPASVAG